MFIERAFEAPIVRRLFSSSPKDPRYHMLSHLSAKFKQAADDQTHEPRAALFLNRFTRTLTIMYATIGIQRIIGISSENIKGRSFYYCIAENCLEDAVKCLETAKSNDSIAYLRFWFRDPRQDEQVDQFTSDAEDTDPSMTDVTISEDDGYGGVQLAVVQPESSDLEMSPAPQAISSSTSDSNEAQGEPLRISSRNSQDSTGARSTTFGERTTILTSSLSTAPTSLESDQPQGNAIELEAVVSCTSDGLVVCLRRARPLIPHIVQDLPAVQPQLYANGLFAAPWATEPAYFPPRLSSPAINNYAYYLGADTTYVPAARVARGPAQVDLMNRIREVAVFAWALTGINGSLADYAVGKPTPESQPPDGVPIWSPSFSGNEAPPYSGNVNDFIPRRDIFGDPGQ